MNFLSFFLIFLGAAIMAFSLRSYYKILKFMQNQNYEEKDFHSPVYIVCFFLITFFLAGYLVIGVRMALRAFEYYGLLIAVIFFLGAVFVWFMVRAQGKLTRTIIKQTTEFLDAMINMIEAKDHYTKGHSEHVRNLCTLLYTYLPFSTRRHLNLRKLEDAAMLHDIGKIGISDIILNKPGKLTPDERKIIEFHPKSGRDILKNSCYRDISVWILYHHERVDGKGYYHLSGNEIPLEARIIALADTFSALNTDRVYSRKYTYQSSADILMEVAGTQLDSELVEIFLKIPRQEIEKTMPDRLL